METGVLPYARSLALLATLRFRYIQIRIGMRWVAYMKPRLLLLTVSAATLLFVPAAARAEDKWAAPASAKSKTNPLPKNPAAIAAGQKLFTTNCVACHGPAGKGDGPAAAALTPKPANFSDAKVTGQTDGELFWKMSEGHGAMISWKTALSETQRWQLVEYVRTLAGKK